MGTPRPPAKRAAAAVSTAGPAGQASLRSVAHRFAGACGRGVSDIHVLGVRYDDDDHKIGDTLVVRMRPGRLEAVTAMSGPARCIACLGKEVVVVDDGGALRTLDGRVLLEGVVDLCDQRTRLLALTEGGAVVDVVTGQELVRVPGARCISGGVVVAAESVTGLDGRRLHEGVVDVATAAAGRLAWSKGRSLVVDGRPFMLSHPAHALCFAFGACFVGSTVSGLSVVDEAGLRGLRPSLRAHGLAHADDGLIVIADLMLATSDDGADFISRDLAAYVRLAEKQGDRRDKHAAQ